MGPAPSTRPPRSPQPRRRGLAGVASLAAVGAAVSAFMLVPTSATTAASAPNEAANQAIAPVAASTRTTTKHAVTQQAAEPANAPGTPATPMRGATRRVATQHTPRSVTPATARQEARAKATEGMSMTTTSDACAGLDAAADAFLQHFYAAHLETSPGQQAADALALDQYALTHTVLVENMLEPVLGGARGAADAFLEHVYAAHLQASPGQQVADALALDQYVTTHTVMIENMIAPLAGLDTTSC